MATVITAQQMSAHAADRNGLSQSLPFNSINMAARAGLKLLVVACLFFSINSASAIRSKHVYRARIEVLCAISVSLCGNNKYFFVYIRVVVGDV